MEFSLNIERALVIAGTACAMAAFMVGSPATAAPLPGDSGPTAQSPAPQRSLDSTDALREQVLDLVNQERAGGGCDPLRANDLLQTAAQQHSDDMAARGFFDHVSPEGVGPDGRIEAAGYSWSTVGENIAAGHDSAESVMSEWMNSDGHRSNILDCSFTELGVGITLGEGGPWWTQAFAAPA